MFNTSAKNEAIAAAKVAEDIYETEAKMTNELAATLFECRRTVNDEQIPNVELYINGLANTPKAYVQAIEDIKIEVGKFNTVVDDLVAGARTASYAGGTMAGASVGVGAATAAFAPTAAIAIATTFGTASTGTAISALGGAAATNAALAWLGGGTLAVGGGGMAAGEAVLALAGPVGWTIGGLALLGTGIWLLSKNGAIAEQATAHAIDVKAKIAALQTAQIEIVRLKRATTAHADGLLHQLDWLTSHTPPDYDQFNEEQKLLLGAMINNVESLCALLGQKVA